MRLLLVGNPASGGGRGLERLRIVEDELRRSGARVERLVSERPGHVGSALAAAAREADAERVVACGGDGLVQEAATALARGDVPLAVIPGGRGNDFARALGVPLDLVEAARLAASNAQTRRVDLASANGRLFCTVAACGLDAEVARRARVTKVPLPGPTAYVAQLLAQLVRGIPAFDAELTIDGRAERERLMVLAVANSPTYGGGFRIAPRARIDDGRIDACLIRATSRARALTLFPFVFAGRHEGLREVRFVTCEELRVVAPSGLEVGADGEAVATQPCTYRVDRGVLPAVVGPGFARGGTRT